MSAGLLRVAAPLRLVAARRSYNLSRQATLIVLCALWFIPGIVGRAPWKPAETILVPVVAESMAAGELLVPRLFGEPYLDLPPLYNVTASAAAHVLTPALEPHEAMRVGNLPWLVLGLLLVGCAVGWVHGSRVGWRAVLLVTGSPALVLHVRTLNPDLTLLALGASGIIGLLLMRTRPLRGSLVLGAAAAVGLWSSGTVALWYVALLALLPQLWRARAFCWREQVGVVAALLIGFVGLGLWLLVLRDASADLPARLAGLQWVSLHPRALAINAQKLVSDGVWVLWPALPFAALTVVRLRQHGDMPAETRVGLQAACAAAIAIICAGGLAETSLFLLLPAAAVIAAVGVTGLTREIAKAMDWFAIIVLGGGLIGFFWLIWLLAVSGVSPTVMEWLAQRGVNSPVVSWAAAVAVLATLAWLALMMRIGRSPERSVLNWMAGATMGWWVFTLLWLPEVDRVKGYREMAHELQEQLPVGQCVAATGVRPLVVAQLEYFTGRRLRGTGQACGWQLSPATAAGSGEVVWSGGRAGDRGDDRLQLVRLL